MKNQILKLAAAALVLAAIFLGVNVRADVLANPNGYNAFGGKGTTQGTTNTYFIAGNYTLGTGSAVVRYLNVSSDLATSAITFYQATNKVTITNMVSGGTNFGVTSTNGFAAGDILLVKHTASDTYERLPVWLVQNTNQIVLRWPPAVTLTNNDVFWLAKPNGSIAIGAASNSVPTGAGTFIYAGQYGLPLLIEINGTSWAQIHAVSGDYR